MKAPLEWIKDYVDIPVSTAELCEKMVMHGLGVEGVSRAYEAYDGVVVGKLHKIEKHRNADRLLVCLADIGKDEPLQIVTGAPNVYEGMLCPVALDGADLPCGTHIEAGTIREVKSDGMLCSGEELCLSEQDIEGADVDGILDLNESFIKNIGNPFFGAAGMDSEVIDFEINSNRGDCMSVLGIAREIGAALGQTVREPVIRFEEIDERAEKYVTLDVQDKDLCPRYTARVFKDIRIEPSPSWMQRRLLAAGVRPISNIVDITNYVMLELGYPQHAFDYRTVKDGHIIVRRGKQGETMVTLDGKKHVLNKNMLVIADSDGAIGLAGVMGGENSEIVDDTPMVLLEVAKFDGPNNRHTSRELGIFSEAAARFSKGIDDTGVAMASERAAQLFYELGCGTVLSGRVDTQKDDPQPVIIDMRAARINTILGTDLSDQQMVDALLKENIQTQESEEGRYVCTVPYYRQDLRIEEDLAEEIARIVGYDNLPLLHLHDMECEGGLTNKQAFIVQVRQLLSGMGLHETMSPSMIGPGDLDAAGYAKDDPKRDSVIITNPLGEEYSLMRTTVIPSMAKALSLNARNKTNDAVLFELSNVHANEWKDGLPKETMVLCIGALGEKFLWVKGVLDALFRRFNAATPAFVDGGGVQYHPTRKALMKDEDRIVGEIGEIHPDVLNVLDIDQRAVVMEIELDVLYKRWERDITYKPLPRYPAIERDMALLVKADVPVGPMMDTIREQGGNLMENVSLFDVYRGEQVPEGFKSVAFTLCLRDPNRTLRDEEANKVFTKVVRALEQAYGAKLRGE